MANPGTMTASIISGDVRDQFRAAMNDVIAPYKFSDTLLLAWINQGVKDIITEWSAAVNDTAILTIMPIPITTITTSPDICVKVGATPVLVAYCQMKAAEYAKDAAAMKTYWDLWHASLKAWRTI